MSTVHPINVQKPIFLLKTTSAGLLLKIFMNLKLVCQLVSLCENVYYFFNRGCKWMYIDSVILYYVMWMEWRKRDSDAF
jgi:hypothetical protein